jgi:hypothetical protein
MDARWHKQQVNICAAHAAGFTPEMKAMFDYNTPIIGIPTIKQMKLSIKKFDANAPYETSGQTLAKFP